MYCVYVNRIQPTHPRSGSRTIQDGAKSCFGVIGGPHTLPFIQDEHT